MTVYLDDKGSRELVQRTPTLNLLTGRSFAINYHLCTDSSDLTRNRTDLIKKERVIIIFGTLFAFFFFFFLRRGVNLSREKNIRGAIYV